MVKCIHSFYFRCYYFIYVSTPFENPTIISNIVEILSMMILPGACVVAFGHMIKNKKQGWVVF
ncbi:potassium-transporting ATPase subunit KdpA, partial [Clostridioides difficile]